MKESFSDKLRRLAEIVIQDEQLQGVVAAWPEMSEEAKHICKKLAGLCDDE